jgi:uncharacterized membrane protein (UPF0127 family)
MRTFALLTLSGILWFAGCSGKSPATDKPSTAPAAGADAANGYLNQAQPRLATVKLWLGDQELITEVARTPTEIMTGMMFRTNIAETEAMLFLLPSPQRASFYMRNTIVPLSCAYIDADGNVLETHDLQPREEKPVVADASNVLFVLETAQGWFQRHNITPGAIVRTQYGPLRALDWSTLRPRTARSQ